MADHLQPYHHQLLTNDALKLVYEQLVDIFARYEIRASFAFVMAFVLDDDERQHFRDELLGDENDEWLRPYREDVGSAAGEGWHQPDTLEIVRAAGAHEIACHSFCHRPLSDFSISREGADRELDAALRVARLKGLELNTFVFPRNELGHLAALRSHGFIGYRKRLRRPSGGLGRALSLAEEFNVWPKPQFAEAAIDGLVPIPSGRFLNWHFGFRAKVPASTTVARWRNLLHSAVNHNGIIHLWLHPHNLITGPGTRTLLEQVLEVVAVMRGRGDLRVLTQRDYCREILATSRLAKAA